MNTEKKLPLHRGKGHTTQNNYTTTGAIKDIFDISDTEEDRTEDLKEPQSFSSIFPEAAIALKPFDYEILWRAA